MERKAPILLFLGIFPLLSLAMFFFNIKMIPVERYFDYWITLIVGLICIGIVYFRGRPTFLIILGLISFIWNVLILLPFTNM